ncbi:hypothetical protein GQR58_023591 [Nymphon striatum]|nr:hypothetical protein GQR58_023591 [Nymphon striatum]
MNRHLTTAIYAILKPLVGLMHRNGLSFGEFSTIAKHAFIKETEKELLASGQKATTSSLAIITGLTRKDVAALRKQDAPKAEEVLQQNRAIRVISGLGFRNDSNSFESLVLKHSGDIPYQAILKELLRSEAVEVIDKKKVALIRAAYIPSDDENGKYEHLAEDVSQLISTIKHNIISKDLEPRYQRKVCYDSIPAEFIDEFKALANEENQKLLVKLNKWLADHDVDNQSDIKNDTPVKVGVGVYYFEDPSEVTSIFLNACGGGTSVASSGGISGTGITMGRIDNFGSIIVNGVRFDVENAEFIRDGESASGQEEYSVGEFVRNIVEVSGIKDANGDIQATSIKLKSTDFVPGTSENELKGTVSELDTTVQTFTINGIIIDYSQANFEDFGTQTLSNGLYVEVESDSMIVGNVLKADKIELEDESIEIDEGTEAKIEGQITRFDSVNDFDVNGLRVTVDSNTEFEDGNINDLSLGVFVEVEGETNSAGVIVADSIEFEESEDELNELEGFIDSSRYKC